MLRTISLPVVQNNAANITIHIAPDDVESMMELVPSSSVAPLSVIYLWDVEVQLSC